MVIRRLIKILCFTFHFHSKSLERIIVIQVIGLLAFLSHNPSSNPALNCSVIEHFSTYVLEWGKE